MRLTIAIFIFLLSLPLAAHAGEITIGVAGPMTGAMESIGKQMKEGVDIAVADLNLDGGILGQKIAVSMQDDGCKPERARVAADRFVDEKVAVVFGHGCSAASLAAARIYADKGILQIETGAPYGLLTEQRLKTFFRVSAANQAFARAIGQYTIKHNHNAKVAIVTDRSPVTRDLTGYMKDYFKTSPLQLVDIDNISFDQKDFSAVIGRLRDAQAEVVICACYLNEAGLLARQIRGEKLDVFFYGWETIDSPEFLDIVGKGNADKIVAISYARASPQNYLYRHLQQSIWRRLQMMEVGTANMYAAIELYAEAVRKANSFDTAKVAEVLHRDIFPTALGNIQFSKDGDRLEPDFAAIEWIKGVRTVKQAFIH